MGYYPQESPRPISTMGTLLGVHPSLSLELWGPSGRIRFLGAPILMSLGFKLSHPYRWWLHVPYVCAVCCWWAMGDVKNIFTWCGDHSNIHVGGGVVSSNVTVCPKHPFTHSNRIGLRVRIPSPFRRIRGDQCIPFRTGRTDRILRDGNFEGFPLKSALP